MPAEIFHPQTVIQWAAVAISAFLLFGVSIGFVLSLRSPEFDGCGQMVSCLAVALIADFLLLRWAFGLWPDMPTAQMILGLVGAMIVIFTIGGLLTSWTHNNH